jgi:hypothetical protein
MRLDLRGFEVYNEGNNAVVVLLESDDQRCKEFFKSATLERPSLALVDNVKSEEYTGEVARVYSPVQPDASGYKGDQGPVRNALTLTDGEYADAEFRRFLKEKHQYKDFDEFCRQEEI